MAADTPVFNVTAGKTYLVRIINAAVDFQMFVGFANHNLTVVELDAEYAQPYVTQTVVSAPGKTTNVLSRPGSRPILHLGVRLLSGEHNTCPIPEDRGHCRPPQLGREHHSLVFPRNAQTPRTQRHLVRVRIHQVPSRPTLVPGLLLQTVDEDLFFTISYATQPCSTCSFPNFSGIRIAASINNVTFKDPTVSLLQAYRLLQQHQWGL